MKHIIKNIALGAALLPVAAVAQTEKEYTDSVASQVNVAFRTVNEADLMGGVSTVNMIEQAKKDYTTYSLDGMDALVGGYNGQLWNQGEALVLVDGVPRDANNVLPTEIEQITFLKAASAVVLYGSRAAKGVILITTKHGRNDGLNVSVRGNASLYVPKSYPSIWDRLLIWSFITRLCRTMVRLPFTLTRISITMPLMRIPTVIQTSTSLIASILKRPISVTMVQLSSLVVVVWLTSMPISVCRMLVA